MDLGLASILASFRMRRQPFMPALEYTKDTDGCLNIITYRTVKPSL